MEVGGKSVICLTCLGYFTPVSMWRGLNVLRQTSRLTHSCSQLKPARGAVCGLPPQPLKVVLPVRSTLGIRIGAERPTLVHTQ